MKIKKPEGWICPRCRKALAPWIRECECVEEPNIPDLRFTTPWMTPQTADTLSPPVSPPVYTVC